MDYKFLSNWLKFKWVDRFSSLAVAFALALMAWLYGSNRDQEIIDNVTIPVVVTLNSLQQDHFMLDVVSNMKVRVSFSGSPLKIREFQRSLEHDECVSKIEYSVTEERLGEYKFGDNVVISESDIPVPQGVRARLVDGKNKIPVTVYRVGEKLIPVRLESGMEGSVLKQILIEPASVLVKGPIEILERTKSMPTHFTAIPFSPMGFQNNVSQSVRVSVVEELEGKPVRVLPAKVLIRSIPEPKKIYDLSDVSIRFLCPSNFAFKPRFTDERSAKIDIKIQGPVLSDLPKILAYIDLTARPGTPGLNVESVKLQLPREFLLLEEFARERTIELIPLEGAKKTTGPLGAAP